MVGFVLIGFIVGVGVGFYNLYKAKKEYDDYMVACINYRQERIDSFKKKDD